MHASDIGWVAIPMIGSQCLCAPVLGDQVRVAVDSRRLSQDQEGRQPPLVPPDQLAVGGAVKSVHGAPSVVGQPGTPDSLSTKTNKKSLLKIGTQS